MIKQDINIESDVVSKEEYDALMADYLQLKYDFTKIQRMIFGSKSEKYYPVDEQQLSFDFGGKTELEAVVKPKTEQVVYERKKTIKKGHPRPVISSTLPRREEILEPKTLPQGSVKIGVAVTEILEYNPSKIYVRKITRPKYSLPNDQGVVIADLPSLPIPKGNAGPGLLAYIIVSKFIDHLPIYRQRMILNRLGVKIPESTMNGWIKSVSTLLNPLYDKLRTEITASDYLQVDETTMPVLTKDKPGSTHKGYHWVYYSPLTSMVCFDYCKGRGAKYPKEFLRNFKGSIQTDAYVVYDYFEQQKHITSLACLAHARRKFENAKDNDKPRAEIAIGYIQRLYQIEKEAKDGCFTHKQRYDIRQDKAIGVLNELKKWLDIQKHLPKSPMGSAISYLLNIWSRIENYVEDGKYEIDNNIIENSIRPVALGRKNYLFSGSHESAERNAMMYSFMGTCKINNVNALLWLKDVLSRIQDHSCLKLDELLPQNWIKDNPEAKLNIIDR